MSKLKTVVMLVGVSGTRDGKEWPPKGAPIDLPDAEAADLIAAGFAREADEVPVTQMAETATMPAGETRAKRATRSRDQK